MRVPVTPCNASATREDTIDGGDVGSQDGCDEDVGTDEPLSVYTVEFLFGWEFIPEGTDGGRSLPGCIGKECVLNVNEIRHEWFDNM